MWCCSLSDKELKDLPHTKVDGACQPKKIIEERLQNKITLNNVVFTEQLNIAEQVNHLLKYSYIRKRVKEAI